MPVTTSETPLQTTTAVPEVPYKNAKQRRYEARGARRIADRKMARMRCRAERHIHCAGLSLPDEREEQTAQVPPISDPFAENQVGSSAKDRLMAKLLCCRELCASLALIDECQVPLPQILPTSNLLVLQEQFDSLQVALQEHLDSLSLATRPNSLPDGENTSAEKNDSFQSSLRNPLPVGLLASAAQPHPFQPTPWQLSLLTAPICPEITSQTVVEDTMGFTELSARQYGEAANEPRQTLMSAWTDPTVDCDDFVGMLWQDEIDHEPSHGGMEEQTREYWGTVDPASFCPWWWPNVQVEQPKSDEHEQRWGEKLRVEDHASEWCSSFGREEARSSEATIDHIVWGAITDSDSDTDTDIDRSDSGKCSDLNGVLFSDISASVAEQISDAEQHRMQSSENFDQSKCFVKDGLADCRPAYDYGNAGA